MTEETRISLAIQHHVKRQGFTSIAPGLVVKYQGNATSHSGIPDLIGGYKGRPFAVETKTQTGRARPLQVYMLNLFAAHGYVTGVVRSVEDFERLFI